MEADYCDASCNESYLDVDSCDILTIVKIQAFIRGTLVRKHMKALRDEYLKLAESIDERRSTTVRWETPWPSNPRFVKIKKARKLDIERNGENQGERGEHCLLTRDKMSVEQGRKEQDSNNMDRNDGYEVKPMLRTEKYICDRISENCDREGTQRLKSCDVQSNSLTQENHETVVKKANSLPRAHHDPHAKGEHPDFSKEDVIKMQGPEDSEVSSFTDVTSIWESSNTPEAKEGSVKNINSSSILEVRKNIAMELLWVQQAINSRKNYLRLKSQLD